MAAATCPRKQLIRRTDRDLSQLLRGLSQGFFLLLNVWIGIQFFLFVRQFETGTPAGWTRPAGVEGWLPIAGMMNTKYLFLTGEIPAIHPAAMFLFLTFVSMSLLLRKAFCGWLCPVGSISEWLWKFGRKTFRRNWALPKWLDIPLRGLKYLLLGFFVWAVWSMNAEAISGFLRSPYGIVADVRMLNFFRFVSGTAAIVLAVLLIGSVFVKNLWCRYLCPYGALMGLTALLSPLRIRRNPDRCIDCGKCAKACPSLIPVDVLRTVRTPECTGCLTCIASCPVDQALELRPIEISALKRANILTRYRLASRRLTPRAMAFGIAAVFFAAVVFARASGHWHGAIPDDVVKELLPRVAAIAH